MAETLQDWLEQLKAISPLPDDNALTDELLAKYDKLTEKLAQTKDPLVIAPILYSIGFYDGYGVYWSVLHRLESLVQASFYPISSMQPNTTSAAPGCGQLKCWVI